MRILVPADGKAPSLAAVKKASELVKTDGASLKLVTVVTNREIRTFTRYSKIWQHADGSAFDSSTRLMDRGMAARQMTQDAACLLDAMAAELDTDAPPEKTVLIGHPVRALVSAAAADHTDLIVLGCRRFHGLKAKRLSALAPCPVLVVHS